MSDDNTPDDYEIGYGKPPKDTQFQKGASGNLKGRPRKPLDFDHELIKESKSYMTINENGRRKRISKHEVAVKQLLKQALTGSPQALKNYFALLQRAHERVALEVGPRPNNSGKYTAKDLSDDQLAEIIMRGEEERKKLGLSSVLNTE